jgi:predicted negative regulator of RcsB-dependent stress response
VRAETRHQLKEDRFNQVTLQTWGRIRQWADANRSTVMVAGVVLVVVILAGVGGWYYLDQQDQSASMTLNQAVRTLNTPLRPAGVPAQPDYQSFASAQERATAANKQLQDVISKYPHTRSAEFARYLLGTTAVSLGNNSEAESDLKSVADSSNADLAALAKFALASLYRSENRGKDAIGLYQDLINKPTTSVGKATAQLELAATYQETNQPLDARKTYEQVQKDNPSKPAGQMAMAKLQELK